ncbi:MAG: hypothetical protein AAGJ40_01415 [Planctomycetota bacterium]
MNAPIWDTIKPMLGTWVSSSDDANADPSVFGESSQRGASDKRWQAGDWVVYRKTKRSKNPGRRAANVQATRKGETYAYVVDKFWVVEQVLDDCTLLVRTPGGKRNAISIDDPNLMKAGLIARIRWGERFRRIEREYGRAQFMT